MRLRLRLNVEKRLAKTGGCELVRGFEALLSKGRGGGAWTNERLCCPSLSLSL